MLSTVTAIVGLLLLGTTAYEGNIDSKLRHEVSLMYRFIKYNEINIEDSAVNRDPLIKFKIINLPPDKNTSKDMEQNFFNSHFDNWKSLFRSNVGGYVKSSGKYYSWTFVPSEKQGGKLVAIRQNDANHLSDFFKTTGTGLIGSGIFVMYIIVWGALIIGNLFKKLTFDQQLCIYQCKSLTLCLAREQLGAKQ